MGTLLVPLTPYFHLFHLFPLGELVHSRFAYPCKLGVELVLHYPIHNVEATTEDNSPSEWHRGIFATGGNHCLSLSTERHMRLRTLCYADLRALFNASSDILVPFSSASSEEHYFSVEAHAAACRVPTVIPGFNSMPISTRPPAPASLSRHPSATILRRSITLMGKRHWPLLASCALSAISPATVRIRQ